MTLVTLEYIKLAMSTVVLDYNPIQLFNDVVVQTSKTSNEVKDYLDNKKNRSKKGFTLGLYILT